MGWPTLRWTGSLFARVLLLQVAVAIILVVVLSVVFLAGQPRVLVQNMAPLWTAALRSAAQASREGARTPLTPYGVEVTADIQVYSGPPPASASMLGERPLAPRYRLFLNALRDNGIEVKQMALSGHGSTGVTWLGIADPDNGELRWVGLPGALEDTVMHWRGWLGIALSVAVFMVAAAWLSRRVVRPLTELQQQVRKYSRTGQLPAAAPASAPEELRALADQFARFAAERQQQDAERDTMLAGLSHDLRTPLGRIRMAAELLPDAEGVDKRRESIVRNAQVADQLLDSFLALIRSGAEPLDEAVNLNELLLKLQQSGEHDDVQWLRIDPIQGRVVPASSAAIERVVVNLLDNARKHGQSPVEIELLQDGMSAVLRVRDHGNGIRAADRERLLKPFYRGAYDRGTPGTGLGLSVVERTIRRHGGSLQLLDAQPGLLVEMRWPLKADQDQFPN